MKHKWFFCLAVLTISLFSAKVYAQMQYQFVIRGDKPSSYNSEYGMIQLQDYYMVDCHYPENWDSDKFADLLYKQWYVIKVRRYDGVEMRWRYRMTAWTELLDLNDGCDEYYVVYYRVENDDPNFDPGISGPAALTFFQIVEVERQAVLPDNAETYLEPVFCNPGTDIRTAWSEYPSENTEVIDALIRRYGGTIPEGEESEQDCWGSHHTSFQWFETDEYPDDGNCYRTYKFTYGIDNLDCSGGYHYFQLVHMPAPDFSTKDNKLLLDTITIYGCDITDGPGQCEYAEDFEDYGIEFENLLYEDSLRVEMFSEVDEGIVNNQYRQYKRYYRVEDPCTGVEKYLAQYLKVHPYLTITCSRLRDEIYHEDNVLPPPYTNINQLKEKGLRLEASCPNPIVECVGEDESIGLTPSGHTIYRRTYAIRSEEYEWLADTVYQRIRYVPENGDPFIVTVEEASCENGGKARAYIEDSNLDEGCPSCLGQNQLWFRMEWVNHTNPEKTVDVVYHNEEDDIWSTDELYPGQYTLKIYATCDDYPDSKDDPIWRYDFEIKQIDEGDIYVNALNNAWSLANSINSNTEHFYNTNTLLPWVHDVCGYDEAPDEEWADTRTDPNKRITYQWKGNGSVNGYPKDLHAMIGRTEYEYEKSPDRQYFSWAPEFKDRMGHLLYDGRMWAYELGKGRNDLRVEVEYTNRDGTMGWDYGEFTVYFACLISAFDPNEIYGPTGYDSVHFINATDPITYTINYENDPEFATGAASRVKITCPLDDKGVPNTFRLGNFGFGDFTFEVPPMASQYSQRLDLTDSLGVWLDVTAGLRVPDNYAYWIFQSVDPATGLPPVGPLGFLPVNDTLNPGNGEGYVTFTIDPNPSIVTGDEITEQAHIVFDQNDTVPTNTYTNRFDAIAPSSVLQGDASQAGEGILNLTFTASDDAEGSGVDVINLYVSIDNNEYELVGKVNPDSVYQYRMELGTQFEFFGCAVDHVNNTEGFKTTPEYSYIRGTAPTDIRLSASTFDEDASLYTVIGSFSTIDDQMSDLFVYTLVSGEGDTHNALFDIVGNALITNNDFRCYGLYDFSIRVRSLDLSDQYVEKVFSVHALRNMTPEITTLRDYVCLNQPYYFAGEWLDTGGIYYDTLQTTFGCDSIVCLVLDNAPAPVVNALADEICYGYDYDDNGFNLTADTLALLTQGWTMENDLVLSIDRYVENYYGCYDTTRLALTVHPAFNYVDAVSVCQTDLPYQYQGVPFYRDTVAVFSYQTGLGCDSVYTLNLSVKQQLDQSNDLANGWNWFSTFVDQSDGEGLTNLEEALNGNGQMIKSKTAFVTYDPDYNMWFGNLEAINNTSMFMVKMRDPQVARLTGCPADIDTIMLASGWTWIGYPLTDTTSVNQLTPAIGGAPTNDDVIKSKQSFAMYNAEYGIWFGSLDDMTPGVGYMYLSNANSVKPLYYGNRQRASDVQPLDIPATHWNADDKPFANNMTMMGLISLDGQIIHSDTLEVGAFVNNEQRGSGRAVYIEQMDAYRIFLTVHGEDGETVSFRLFNHSRNKERRIRCDEQLTFMADRHFGTLDNPYVFAFETYYDKYIQAEICEGEYYTDHNFRVFEAGTYFMELTTAQGNDSIVRLDLTVNPVYHVEEEVVAVEFPFEYEGVVFDRPGTFVLPFQTAAACDSVWEVTVTPYEGLRELLISPQPASRTQRVSLYYPFTQAEQQGVVVEVYTVGGSLLQSKRPTRFPIELDPFLTDGTYMVKITLGTGEVLSGKIIIR